MQLISTAERVVHHPLRPRLAQRTVCCARQRQRGGSDGGRRAGRPVSSWPLPQPRPVERAHRRSDLSPAVPCRRAPRRSRVDGAILSVRAIRASRCSVAV